MLANSLGEDVAVARLHRWRGALLAGVLFLAGCGGGGDDGGGSTPAPPPIRLVLVANSNANDSSISVYTLDSSNGSLTRHPESPFSGTLGLSPTSIAVTPSGRFAYVANSMTTDVSALAVNPSTGAISLVPPLPYDVASTPQFVAVEPLGRFAYVALSVDRVEAYKIDSASGALTAIAGGEGVAAATTPRHIAIDPSGRFAYVANGPSNSVTIYSIDQGTGALSPPQVHNLARTLPDTPLPVFTAIDPLGRYAYIANSGTNDVSAFTLDPSTGALTEIAGSPVAVPGGPNSVAVEPAGRFAYTANLIANTLSILSIDATTGLPAEIGTVQLDGSGPRQVIVDPSGKFVYVTLSSTNEVAAYRIDPASGALAQVQGSPYQTGSTPLGVIATGPIQ